MSQSIGGFSAVGLGALIGATLALAIDPTGTGLWIIGALVGGVVAYLVHEWRVVVRTLIIVYNIRPSWSGICGCVTAIGRVLGSRDFWRYWTTYCAASVVVLSYMLVFLIDPFLQKDGQFVLVLLGMFAGGTLLAATPSALANLQDPHNPRTAEVRAGLLKFARYGNPIAVAVYWPIYGLVVGLARLPQVIQRINSNERMMYFICGSVGAAAGWLIGHGHFGELVLYGPVSIRSIAPLAGALAGILLLAVSRAYSRSTVLPSDHV